MSAPDELRAALEELASSWETQEEPTTVEEGAFNHALTGCARDLRVVLAAIPSPEIDPDRLAEAMFYALQPEAGEYHGEGEQRAWLRTARAVIAYLVAAADVKEREAGIEADIQQAATGGPDFTPKEWPERRPTP